MYLRQLNRFLSIIFVSFFFIMHNSMAAIPADQRDALIALYNSTDGDNWTDNSGWKTPPLDADGFAMPGTEGTWFGITEVADEITNITLIDNNLNGTLPGDIGDLTGLTHLYIQENPLLTGSIPKPIGDLVNLLIVNLSENDLTGSIPNTIRHCEELDELYLNDNRLSESIPYYLCTLSHLQILDLTNNELTGQIPDKIKSMTGLIELRLGKNQLSGSIPYSIGELVTLQYLFLNDNELGIFIPISMMNMVGLLDNVGLDLRNNHLYTRNDGLRQFLNTKQIGNDWESSQDVPNWPPRLSEVETDPLIYQKGEGRKIITQTLNLHDEDDWSMKGATVKIVGNYNPAEDRLITTIHKSLSDTYDEATGTLTFSNQANKEEYIMVLRSVCYENINAVNPDISPRTIRFTTWDGEDNSNALTRGIQFQAENVPPVIQPLVGDTLEYASTDSAVFVTDTLVIEDADNAELISAKIQIVGNYVVGEDTLILPQIAGFVTQFDTSTGLLTITGNGTPDQYEIVLKSVQYRNSNPEASGIKKIQFIVFDGSDESEPVERLVQVTPAPVPVPEPISITLLEPADEDTVDPFIPVQMMFSKSTSLNPICSFSLHIVSALVDTVIECGADTVLTLPENMLQTNGYVGKVDWWVVAFHGTEAVCSDTFSVYLVAETEIETAIEQSVLAMPFQFELAAAYPNPFNLTVVIPYTIAGSGNVRLTIYDTLGRKVRSLVDKKQEMGNYQVLWNGQNNRGQTVPSGVYLIELITNKDSASQKVVLIK